MGCVCCSLSSFVSIVLDALERISLCTVCAMLVCCILFTLLTIMAMGVGIGFHYCTVSNSVEAMEKAAKASSALRSGKVGPNSPGMRSIEKAVKRGFGHRMTRDINEEMPSNNNTVNDIVLGRKYLNQTVLNETGSGTTNKSFFGEIGKYIFNRNIIDLIGNYTVNRAALT